MNGVVMKIEECEQVIGSSQAIAMMDGVYYFTPASIIMGYKVCGVYKTHAFYTFWHNGKNYRVWRSGTGTQNFESTVIKMYLECGNWYDAFTGAMI